MNALTLIRIGEGGRLARLLDFALAGMTVRTACVEEADRPARPRHCIRSCARCAAIRAALTAASAV